MKTKLLKSITGCFLFVCALASLIVTMTLGTPATARAAADGGRVCSVHMLRGLYLWTFDGYENFGGNFVRSEEHTSELQSRFDLVCRLLLEKKKKKKKKK